MCFEIEKLGALSMKGVGNREMNEVKIFMYDLQIL